MDKTEYGNFADHPFSVAEIKAGRSEHGAGLWTPRDALIAALRDIDNGYLKPESVVITFAVTESEKTFIESYQSFPSTFYGVGMLHAAIDNMLAK